MKHTNRQPGRSKPKGGSSAGKTGRPFKVRRKGKTVGRPSKREQVATEIVNWMAEQPEFQEMLLARLSQWILYAK